MGAAVIILLSLSGLCVGGVVLRLSPAARFRRRVMAAQNRRVAGEISNARRDHVRTLPDSTPVDLRTRYRLELRQLSEERFPVWLPDPQKLARAASLRSGDRAQ